MAFTAGVEIEGLSEFLRGLKRLNPELDKALKVELKEVAEDVAGLARSYAPHRSGRARGSIRAGADSRGPYIRAGKKSIPYYGWLDFGSRTPRRNRAPWGGSGAGPKGGRIIYPAIAKKNADVVAGGTRALERAKASVGLT